MTLRAVVNGPVLLLMWLRMCMSEESEKHMPKEATCQMIRIEPASTLRQRNDYGNTCRHKTCVTYAHMHRPNSPEKPSRVKPRGSSHPLHHHTLSQARHHRPTLAATKRSSMATPSGCTLSFPSLACFPPKPPPAFSCPRLRYKFPSSSTM